MHFKETWRDDMRKLTFPLPIVINERLTPEEKKTWRRIKAEPESLLEEEKDDG